MTAHELARALLDGPDWPVYTTYDEVVEVTEQQQTGGFAPYITFNGSRR